MKFQVEVDRELISEYREQMEIAFQEAEGCIIALENSAFSQDDLHIIHQYFDELWVSSTKLNLTPLSESLDDCLKVLDLLLQWRCFPSRMSECLLLLMDRIVHLARDVERSMVIDMQETQNILVSLQNILMAGDVNKLDQGIETAIQSITQNIRQNTIASPPDLNIDLFDTDSNEEDLNIDLFDNDSNDVPTQGDITTNTEVELFIPKTISDPLIYAKEIIHELSQNDALMLLSTISDGNTYQDKSHTQFLLEVGLALNYMADEPINSIHLAQGICLHDIALAAIPDITNKKEKLTTEEFHEIQQHPVRGANLAMALAAPDAAIAIVLEHHERIDGKGYPAGLKGDQISEAGKLGAIIDSFHAMIQYRPHKKFTRSALRAIAELNACVDTQYDKSWIKLFNIFMKQHWLPNQRKINP